jgi:very-short-patch-repair endonuclease
VDFVCYEKRIIIEVDGSQHQIEKDKDRIRDEWLKMQGFKVLRFWNNEVLRNMEGVYEVIKESCLSHPPPTPSRRGRGKAGPFPLDGGGLALSEVEGWGEGD